MTVWYNYPMDNPGGGYGEILDPYCSSGGGCTYLKPDTNMSIPSGTPITALQSGTITSVKDQGKGDGGLSVVIKSDNPINSVATHVAYNFLGSSNVSIGQHIQAGQQVGKAGSPYGINFALALTPDNNWGGSSFNLNATGDKRLDPRILLNSVRSGAPIPQSTGGGSTGGGTGLSGLPFGLGGAISIVETSIVNLTEEIGVFLIALLIIGLGVFLLAQRQIEGAAKTGVKAGMFL